MSELYQVGVNTINHHVKEIYRDGELLPGATIRKYRIVQIEGARQVERMIDHYNLEMIIAVGYRVHSNRGTQFRQWVTSCLSECLVKGFTLNGERLKGADSFTDYFDELLARIREIFALARDFRIFATHTAPTGCCVQPIPPSPAQVILARGFIEAGGATSQIKSGAISLPKDVDDSAVAAAGCRCCICHK